MVIYFSVMRDAAKDKEENSLGKRVTKSSRQFFPPIITDKCIFQILISDQENYDDIQEIQDREAANVLQSLSTSSDATVTGNFVNFSNGTSIFLKPLEVQVININITDITDDYYYNLFSF